MLWHQVRQLLLLYLNWLCNSWTCDETEQPDNSCLSKKLDENIKPVVPGVEIPAVISALER